MIIINIAYAPHRAGGGTREDGGGELVAQALAAARGQAHEHVPPLRARGPGEK